MSESKFANYTQSLMVGSKYSANKNKVCLILSDVFSFIIAACVAYMISFPDPTFNTQMLSHAALLRGAVFTIALLLTLLWFWGSQRHYTYREAFLG